MERQRTCFLADTSCAPRPRPKCRKNTTLFWGRWDPPVLAGAGPLQLLHHDNAFLLPVLEGVGQTPGRGNHLPAAPSAKLQARGRIPQPPTRSELKGEGRRWGL